MFEELRTFVDVAESKNFTKTGKKLNFSQPTISQQVKKVEMFFGNVTLLTRSANSKQVELTAEGEVVYRRAKEILALLGQTFEEVEACRHQGEERLRIGASETIGNFLLPRLLEQYAQRWPQVVVEVQIANTRQTCDALAEGRVDIGLIEGRNIHHNFRRIDFFTDRMILVAAPQVAQRVPGFSASLLGKLPWVTREKGSGTEQYLRAFTESNNILVEHAAVCNSNYAIKEMVKQGLGVTVLSQLVVEGELASGELVELPAHKSYSRSFSYILPEGRACSPAAQDLISILEALGER
ncbi:MULTISPECIES: LysR family transcriptional regulator [Eubacteriales]|uniref:DNA-binding transcriptional regulator, LysR family n=1 Tax=Bittarella massiliensis (ex Durand et al. 2017) TaxID=1720313 RepID=A0AAQ1RW27_9FIRM|nr:MULTISPECIES: LysR family transcriptional regulator [Eubacteriales]MZL70260.1 LysR family transcriptional regulator [Bittarella massiliensis (ex Durand et al. 2017)]MZL80974.1 LysR family transcriptional regulator [Bittarella massiliensis (ex Durand et al. 2017)]SHG16221.1 DNA-binding transcriptional regulator, LysR family [Bittarella massiliensis (ex Durand et al. 2017)]